MSYTNHNNATTKLTFIANNDERRQNDDMRRQERQRRDRDGRTEEAFTKPSDNHHYCLSFMLSIAFQGFDVIVHLCHYVLAFKLNSSTHIKF